MSQILDHRLRDSLLSLVASPYLLICSDFDGTLAPIAPRPEQAKLMDGAADLLMSLARLPQTRVAIISGRSRDDLRRHSRLANPIELIGSHGAELPVPSSVAPSTDLNAQMTCLEAAIQTLCRDTVGAWIERKALGLAIHVRQVAPQHAATLMARILDALQVWPSVHTTEGKAVLDLSFSRATKGDAIRWLRAGWGLAPRVIYLGDDVTDEAAFAALEPTDMGVKVGFGPTQAGFRVGDEGAALHVLSSILDMRAQSLKGIDALLPLWRGA